METKLMQEECGRYYNIVSMTADEIISAYCAEMINLSESASTIIWVGCENKNKHECVCPLAGL